MKKQLLTLILLCALTLTCFTALSSVQVKADSSDVKILSYSWYAAPTNDMATNAGDLVVVGEVQNVGTKNILAIHLNAIAYVNGTQVDTTSFQPYGNNLKPGQKAPFYLDFLPEYSVTGDLSWVGNVTDVIVYVGYIEYSDLEMYQGLTVSSENSTASGVYSVVGSVQNTGSETIGDVRVVTTFYDASGTVVSLNYTEVLSDSLAPGSSVSFVANPVDNYPASNITSYSTLVQSTIQLPETTTTPTSTPSATPTPSSTGTATPTQTTGQASQDYTLIIVAVIAIVVIVGAVIAILMRSRSKSPEAQ
ncbi:MAG: FxLYD domain-containing protein [Candidatus Bathyarchaeia archaeon]